MADINEEGREWQLGIWNTIAELYENEIDPRFRPVVDALIRRADLQPDETALDLGTGTGSVALAAAGKVKNVIGVDLSPSMIAIAGDRARRQEIENVEFRMGRGEQIPADDNSCDVVISSLCLMYALERDKVAKEIARVIVPGGRFAAAVWAGSDECDIVRFQETAGRFAPSPPVSGVGPGALAETDAFLTHLKEAGIEAEVHGEVTEFDFPNFDLAWEVLAGVTTAHLEPDVMESAKAAVRELMWPDPSQPLRFRNLTLFITGRKLGD